MQFLTQLGNLQEVGDDSKLERSFERVKSLIRRKIMRPKMDMQCVVKMAVTAASPATAPPGLSESKDNLQNVQLEQQVKESRYELLCQQDSKGKRLWFTQIRTPPPPTHPRSPACILSIPPTRRLRRPLFVSVCVACFLPLFYGLVSFVVGGGGGGGGGGVRRPLIPLRLERRRQISLS
jgi:hypothetical protein